DSRIEVTDPTWTPRNLTGAPTLRPFTDPEKMATNCSVRRNILPEPKMTRPASASAMAPTTKTPISVGLARLLRLTSVPLPRLRSLHDSPRARGSAGRSHCRTARADHAAGRAP